MSAKDRVPHPCQAEMEVGKQGQVWLEVEAGTMSREVDGGLIEWTCGVECGIVIRLRRLIWIVSIVFET